MTDADQRLLETFLEAVTIDSPSGSEAAFARWCAERLQRVGCTVTMDDTGPRVGSDTGNLIAELAGTTDGRTVVLSAHMDTVEPGRGIRPVVDDGIVRASGDTILGSDDKAGVAAIIEALERIRETGSAHGTIRVLLTTCEEQGLKGARALSPERVTGDLGLVLDAGGPVGGMVIASPTHHTFSAVFQGVASHAGIEPERGRSAIRMAAMAIEHMPYGRIDAETTANVGAVHGGGATNVVAASCTVTGECRSIDPERAEAVKAGMDAALHEAARAHGGQVTVTWNREYEGQRHDPDGELIRGLSSACERAGVTPYTFTTGGGSDANVLASKGLPTIALASGMTDVHGLGENIEVSQLESLVRLVIAVIDGAVGR